LNSLNVLFELSNFQAEGDTLFVLHTVICIAQLKKMFKFVVVLFKVYHPDILLVVKINGNIDSALTDIGLNFSYFFTDFAFTMHEKFLFLMFELLSVDNHRGDIRRS
jgi:hypothetical protein